MAFHISRLILGLLFFGFGLNGFFHFRPLPPMNEEMMKFNEALQNTRIIMPVVKIFEVIFGLALLANQWTLLSTVALAPICIFIVLAHFRFNRPKGFVMASTIGACFAILLSHHWIELSFLLQP